MQYYETRIIIYQYMIRWYIEQKLQLVTELTSIYLKIIECHRVSNEEIIFSITINHLASYQHRWMHFWLETVKWYHSAGTSRYGWNQWHHAEVCRVIYYGFLTKMTRFNQGNGFTRVYVHVYLSLKCSSGSAAVMMNDLLVSQFICV